VGDDYKLRLAEAANDRVELVDVASSSGASTSSKIQKEPVFSRYMENNKAVA